MGHSHTRPTEVAPFGAMPPDPRTVCARRLAEPSHRLCCHYQHFSYPERAMSYSPPYSPSLFKRPDRRFGHQCFTLGCVVYIFVKTPKCCS